MHLMLSTSDSFLNKQNLTSNKLAFGQNFLNQTISTQELIDWVTSGKAICVAKLENGKRKKQHFLGAQLIGIDIDEGLTRSVDQLIQIPFICQYACYVGPTSSSTLENPRSRIYFALDTVIEDQQEYERIVLRVMQHLSTLGIVADNACKDCVRLFYGSTVEGGWYAPEQILAMHVTESLPPLPQPQQRTKALKAPAELQSPPALNPEELDELEQRIRTALAYIPKRQTYAEWLSVLMAVYNILPDHRGIRLIEEWSPGNMGEVASKFKSFKSNQREVVTIKTLFWMAQGNGWQEDSGMTPDYLVNHQYISECDVSITLDKVWLIRSDMGTGKTELMKELVRKWKTEHGSLPRILILTHRVSLGNNMRERFKEMDIQLYSDHEAEHSLHDAPRLICTPNSIHRLKNEDGQFPTYDLVVIDEIEQQLDHLVGETFGGYEGPTANNIMRHFIANAQAVFALDAHASSLAYGYLKSCFVELKKDPSRLKFLVNTYKVDRGEMHMYTSRDAFLSKMLDTCSKSTKTVAIACDEKRQVMDIAAWLDEAGIDNIMQVHSANSNNDKIRHFLTHINEELPKYRVLIYSPTIGTGVDIQADVDVVFAHFGNQTIIAEEQHQMLVRCRKARQFHVFSRPTSQTNRETDETVVFNRHKQNMIKTGELCELDLEGKQTFTRHQELYLGLGSKLQARRNRGLNDIQYNFRMIAQQNFTLHEASYAENGVEAALAEISDRLYEAIQTLVYTAPILDPTEYQNTLKTNDWTPEIEAGHFRWQIEDLYKTSITEENLLLWDHGKGSARLFRFIDLYQSESQLQSYDVQQEEADIAWKERLHKKQVGSMYQQLFSFIWDGGFHAEHIKHSDLINVLESAPFLNCIDTHKQAIYGVLGRRVAMSKDKEKPLPLVRWLLKQVGIKLLTKRPGKKHDTTEYVLDTHRLKIMLTHAQRRAFFHEIQTNFTRPIFTAKNQ